MSFDYERAGAQGDPRLSAAVRGLLEQAVEAGVPLWKLGPSLVLGFVRFFRQVPRRFFDKSQVPLLYSFLGSGVQPFKMSKSDAAYQPSPVGQQRCGNCSSAYTQIVTGESICSQIDGQIEPGHWCRLWNTDRN